MTAGVHPGPSVSAMDMRLMETANMWVIRELEGRADPGELSAWLNASPAHAEAYRRASLVYGALQAPAARVASKRTSLSSRRIVASVALVLVAAWLARDIPLRLTSEVTDVGESRDLTLPDGSHVDLNTSSAASVDYSGRLREVQLKRGEAWFDVARNPDRPFVVLAGDARVTVLGTAFNVRRTDSGISVSVARGRVEVRRGDQSTVLTPGRAVQVSAETFELSDVPVGRISEWRTGWVGFEQATFAEVVDELARYHRGPLFIASAALRMRPISARLNINAPEKALQVALQAASAKMIELPGGVRIIY